MTLAILEIHQYNQVKSYKTEACYQTDSQRAEAPVT